MANTDYASNRINTDVASFNRVLSSNDTDVQTALETLDDGRTPVVSKSTNYTLTAADMTVLCTGSITITLPTAVGVTGRVYNIKNVGGGTVTVDTTSSQTIDSELSQKLSPDDNMQVISTGLNWVII